MLKSIEYKNNPLDIIDPDIPIITCLQSSDGSEDHTVSIYKNWIFDGNFTHALALLPETLDLCCSSDTKQCKFMSMLHTYSMPFFKQYIDSQINLDAKIREKKKRNKQKGIKRHL